MAPSRARARSASPSPPPSPAPPSSRPTKPSSHDESSSPTWTRLAWTAWATWWWAQYALALVPVRVLFHVVLPPVLKYVWHNTSAFHLAQDDRPVYADVRCVAADVAYGPHPRERLDVIVPTASRSARRSPGARALGHDGTSALDWGLALVVTLWDLITCYPRAARDALARWLGVAPAPDPAPARRFEALLFLHGGGGVAVEPGIQHHQCTAFARAGDARYAVYAATYPLAPECPHPHALVSTLRALSWLKTRQGHDHVVVVGESAGATLVTVAAALVANPAAMDAFQASLVHRHGLAHERVSTWAYPDVRAVVSWYGVLDGESWRGQGFLSWGLAWTFDTVREVSPYPRALTRVPRGVAPNAKHACEFLTLVDALRAGHVRRFPPTLLVSGTTDPLGLEHSARLARDEMLARGLDVTLSEYPAGHAFIGLNPFVLWFLQGSQWRELALPATRETIEFLDRWRRVPFASASSRG